MRELFPILATSLLLAGCGTPNEGGGTELPDPIRVSIIYLPDTSVHVAARQTRLWTIDSSSGTTLSLTARGLLADSMGFLKLPPDSGTYLLESWIYRTPPDSLSLHARIDASTFPSDGSCLNLLGRTSTVQSIKRCGDTLRNPSAGGNSAHPEILSWIQISGSALHPFRVVGGTAQVVLHQVQLWSLEDTLLSFRGVLGIQSGLGMLPTLTEKAHFVVEGWSDAGPSKIQARRSFVQSDSAWRLCADHLASLGSGVTTLHACSLPALMPGDSAGFWTALDFVP